MALKLPVPGNLNKAENPADDPAASIKVDAKPAGTQPPPAKKAPAKAEAKPAKNADGGFSLFGFGKKKTTISAAASPLISAQITSQTTLQGPATNSGFNAAANKTQKIAAAVAATKVTKPKKVTKGIFKLPIIGEKPLVNQLVILLVIRTTF